MKVITYTETGRVYTEPDENGNPKRDDDGLTIMHGGETIERRGIVWSPGPLANTVWVLMAEVVEDGFTPNSSEAVVVDTRTMRRRTDWTLADGLNRCLRNDSQYGREQRLTDYGYGWRDKKIPGTGYPLYGGPSRTRKLSENAWRGIVGDPAEWAADADVVEIHAQDPDQIGMDVAA